MKLIYCITKSLLGKIELNYTMVARSYYHFPIKLIATISFADIKPARATAAIPASRHAECNMQMAKLIK